MRKAAVLSGALCLLATPAFAVNLEFYGQVNKGIYGFNDGANTNTVVVDNDLSSSRFGLKGEQLLDSGLTASFLLESQFSSNNSNSATSGFRQNNTAGQSTTPLSSPANSFAERQARVGLAGGWGAVFLGQQSTAIDGVRDQDLAGARDVMTPDYGKIGNGALFRTSGGAFTAYSVGTEDMPVSSNRAPALRYDTPIFSGFQGRVAAMQGGDADASMVYAGSLLGLKSKAGLGFAVNNDEAGTFPLAAANNNRITTRTDASFSLAHSSGVAATVAYNRLGLTNRLPGSHTPSSLYGKLGYAWSSYEVAADYGVNNHYGQVGSAAAVPATDKLSAWGLAAQYNMGQGVSVAALYRNFSLNRSDAPGLSDIDIFGANLKVKF
ncbi:MAG TPA: porin [Alphaproteobacteria bacterium]|nr:porin [Alphaproteobacteria bacterium]